MRRLYRSRGGGAVRRSAHCDDEAPVLRCSSVPIAVSAPMTQGQDSGHAPPGEGPSSMPSTEAPGGTLRSSSSLVVLISASVLFRAVPALIWRDLPIIRDEQSYAALAGALVRGQGIVPTVLGWLWAPLYPAFLALHEVLFGTVLAARAS